MVFRNLGNRTVTEKRDEFALWPTSVVAGIRPVQQLSADELPTPQFEGYKGQSISTLRLFASPCFPFALIRH
jgi:hypothetical protein